jgi:DNA-binding CsgD family transcriptional regulator
MGDTLELGRTAYADARWDAAYEALARADAADPLAPQDLWRLALAAYLTGRDAEFIAILERAHQAWLAAEDLAGAARCAFWIGFALIDRGETAHATGWFQRAGRLLDRVGGERVERGYLLVPSALAQLGSGDPAEAFRTAGDAVRLAVAFGDPDLLALALHLQGRALLEQRRVTEGLALLDEAMVGVAAGEATPLVTGLVYCSVIGACRRVYAVDRAHEWTAALNAWCERQPDLVPYRGLCLVYRAEIMQLHGAWQQALAESARVLNVVSGEGTPSERATRGAASYQQGEVHRLRGAFADAEQAYRAAAMLGREPQPGLAMLRLAQGDVAAAQATIQRALAESRDAPKRVRLLPAAVEIALAAGDIDCARTACAELHDLAASFGAAMLDALARHAHGALALEEGEALGALIALRQACNAWQALDAPWEEARTRVLVAQACRELGDTDAAVLELDTARGTFARLGADGDVARIDAEMSAGAKPPTATAGAVAQRSTTADLTPRELEVLSLLATGMTNRSIATRLFISEKTVARHVSNIFAKLGLSTRAAATAHAYEHGLVDRAR